MARVVAPASAADVRRAAGAAVADVLEAFTQAMMYALAEEVAARPIIASNRHVHDHLRFAAGFDAVEHSRAMFLDTRNGLIADEVLWSGTIDRSSIHSRELLRRALDIGAAALILIHNHPSGDPCPSDSDVRLTREIERAANCLGIAVLDHIIVASTGTASMRALGLI